MTDKKYCMSSYLAFRYIEKDGVDFYDGLHHTNITPVPDAEKRLIKTADDIGRAIEDSLSQIGEHKIGIMLSGGMDSAILASYLPGAEAYTFRFLDGAYQSDELSRAEYYSNYYG